MSRSPDEPRKGFDPIGPFHPYIVYAGILLVDLLGALLILTGLVWIADQVEDRIWPGGEEWVDF